MDVEPLGSSYCTLIPAVRATSVHFATSLWISFRISAGVMMRGSAASMRSRFFVSGSSRIAVILQYGSAGVPSLIALHQRFQQHVLAARFRGRLVFGRRLDLYAADFDQETAVPLAAAVRGSPEASTRSMR